MVHPSFPTAANAFAAIASICTNSFRIAATRGMLSRFVPSVLEPLVERLVVRVVRQGANSTVRPVFRRAVLPRIGQPVFSGMPW